MAEYISVKIEKASLEGHIKRICRSNLKKPAKICTECPIIEPILEIMDEHGWAYNADALQGSNRLFVNLKSQYYEDFVSRGKRYELRAYGDQWTEEHVYAGRRVELRNAWSRGSLWGTVGKAMTGSLEDIFDSISYKLVEPRAKSRKDAIADNLGLYKPGQKYIAFEVKLDSTKPR